MSIIDSFKIYNVVENDSAAEQPHVCFDIETWRGKVRALEWLNNGKVERTDSHLITNENIAHLFEHYVPYEQIFDAVDKVVGND